MPHRGHASRFHTRLPSGQGSAAGTRNVSGVGLQAIAQCWTSFDVVGDYSHAFQLQDPVQWMAIGAAAHAVGPVNSSSVAVGDFSASRMFLNDASAFVALVSDAIASPLDPQSASTRAAELSTPTWDEFVNKLPLPWTATLFPQSFDAMPLICVWCDRWAHATGSRWQRVGVDGAGQQHLQVGIRELRNLHDTRVAMSASVTARAAAPVWRVVYESWLDAVRLGLGVAGWQRTTQLALQFPTEWLQDGACGRVVIHSGPTGFNPCQGIACGKHGRCEGGVCVCDRRPTYFGEFCEVPPASPRLVPSKEWGQNGEAFHDGASVMWFTVVLETMDMHGTPTAAHERGFRPDMDQAVWLEPSGVARVEPQPAVAMANASSPLPLRSWNVRVRPLDLQRPSDFSVTLPVDGLLYSFPTQPLLIRYRPRIRLSCAPTRAITGQASEAEPGWLAGPHVVTSGCEYTGLSDVTLLFEASAAVELGAVAPVFGEASRSVRLGLANMLIVNRAGAAVPSTDPPLALTGVSVLVPGRVFLVTLTPRLSSEEAGWPLEIRIRAGSVPGADNVESEPLRLDFRFSSRWLLPHRLEGHAGGLVWFLGMSAGTSRWRNPASQAACESGTGSIASTSPACLEAARSSRGASLDTDACIASRGSMACYTADEPSSWWSLSLPSATVLRVLGYEIRDGEDQVRQHLTSWEVQARDGASTDGQWSTLASHPDEPTALLVDRGLARFSVPPSNSTPALQTFRLVQTGPNSRGANDFGVAGTELFGELFLRGDPCAGLSCGAPENGTCVRIGINDTSLGEAIPPVASLTSGFATPGVEAAASAFQGAACRCLGGHAGPACSMRPGARRTEFEPPTQSRNGMLDRPGVVEAPAFVSVLSPAEARGLATAEERLQAMRKTGDGFPQSAFGCLGTTANGSTVAPCSANPVDVALKQAVGPGSLIGSGILGAIVAEKLPGFGPEAYPAPQRLGVWWEPTDTAPFVDNTLGPACLLSQRAASCASPAGKRGDASWGVDLKDLRASISAYALRDGSRPPFATFARSWALEGRASKSATWEELDRRFRDTTLSSNQSVGMFRLEKRSPPVRFVRIRADGANAAPPGTDESLVLFLSGLELFGTVMDARDPCVDVDCGSHGRCAGATRPRDPVRCQCEPGFLGSACDLQEPLPAPADPLLLQAQDAAFATALSVVVLAPLSGWAACCAWSCLSGQEASWSVEVDAADLELLDTLSQEERAALEAAAATSPEGQSLEELEHVKAEIARTTRLACGVVVTCWRRVRGVYWCSWCPCWEQREVRGLPPGKKRLAQAHLRAVAEGRKPGARRERRPGPLANLSQVLPSSDAVAAVRKRLPTKLRRPKSREPNPASAPLPTISASAARSSSPLAPSIREASDADSESRPQSQSSHEEHSAEEPPTGTSPVAGPDNPASPRRQEEALVAEHVPDIPTLLRPKVPKSRPKPRSIVYEKWAGSGTATSEELSRAVFNVTLGPGRAAPPLDLQTRWGAVGRQLRAPQATAVLQACAEEQTFADDTLAGYRSGQFQRPTGYNNGVNT